MRVFGLPSVGIVGGIAFGGWALMALVGPATSVDSLSDQVVTRKISTQFPDDADDIDEDSNVSDDPAEGSGNLKTSTSPLAVRMLRRKVKLMEQGRKFLHGIEDYTMTMQKQEVVKNVLLDEQTILVKCRHKPFSVYLIWITGDTGREVIYVDGKNNGKMIAHDGGWKARIPAFTLATDSMLAMRDARYPVTTAGFLGLMENMLDVHAEDLNRLNVESCELDAEREFDGRPCQVFTTKYQSRISSPVYRKSVTFIDKEWNVPLHSQHFEWPQPGNSLTENELDQATLIESYSFTDIHFGCGLSDHDFDRKNPDYHFR